MNELRELTNTELDAVCGGVLGTLDITVTNPNINVINQTQAVALVPINGSEALVSGGTFTMAEVASIGQSGGSTFAF